jgi:hypothetical protein
VDQNGEGRAAEHTRRRVLSQKQSGLPSERDAVLDEQEMDFGDRAHLRSDSVIDDPYRSLRRAGTNKRQLSAGRSHLTDKRRPPVLQEEILVR